MSSLQEKFKFLLGKNEGGRRKKERKGTAAGEVLLLGGLRVLHVYAPDLLLARWQLAESIPMAVGRATAPYSAAPLE